MRAPFARKVDKTFTNGELGGRPLGVEINKYSTFLVLYTSKPIGDVRTMIRLAKLTDYGLLLMTIIAKSRNLSVHTARDLAEESRLPLPTVSKVLKLLLQSGLLLSHRGIKGGYSLAKEPAEISVAEIVTSLEGPIALTECSTDISGLCDLERSCPIKRNQRVITQVVRGALDKVALSDLIQPLQLTAITGANGKLVTAIGYSSGRVQ